MQTTNLASMELSNVGFIKDTEPSPLMTPLYMDVLNILKECDRARKMHPDYVLQNSKVTKQASRIRLALDALEDAGYLEFLGERIVLKSKAFNLNNAALNTPL